MSEQKINGDTDINQEEIQDDFEFEGEEVGVESEVKQEEDKETEVDVKKDEEKPVEAPVIQQEPAKEEEVDDKPDIPQEIPESVKDDKQEPIENKEVPIEDSTVSPPAQEPEPQTEKPEKEQKTEKQEPVKKEKKQEPVLQEKSQNTQIKEKLPSNQDYLKSLQKIHEITENSKNDGKIIINVVHCFNCKAHSYCTHHKEEKYQKFYKTLKERLEPRNSKFHVTQNYLQKDLTMGAFEVYYNDELIYSKLETMKWPNIKNLIEKLENHQTKPEPIINQEPDVKA